MPKDPDTTAPIAATPAAPGLTPSELERLVVGGDLSVLDPAAKARHYLQVCAAMGLNPTTKPLEYIRLNGKEVLYAKRDCTDQLRKIHDVRIEITARERHEDLYVVTARASLSSGRSDESIGAVPLGGLKGENLANAIMKCETKAKRRVTLSICGLGMLDESEVEGQAFAALPRESTRETARPPSLIAGMTAQREAAGTNADRLPAEARMPEGPAVDAPTDELPPVPDQILAVPRWMAKACPPLRAVGDTPISAWSLADCEQVVEAASALAARAKSPRGKAWASALAADAKVRAGELSFAAAAEVQQ